MEPGNDREFLPNPGRKERLDFALRLHDRAGCLVRPRRPGDDHPDSPWHDKLVLWERVAGEAINTNIVLGDIDYQDGLIPFGDSNRA